MRMSTFAAAVMIGLLAGCSSTRPGPSNLTPGMAKKSIIKGVTHQADVMEVFGPPDLVTHRDDLQIWTYDKISNDLRVSQDYLGLVIYGRAGRRASSSSTSTMLIVYFDGHDIVQDYRMSTTRF